MGSGSLAWPGSTFNKAAPSPGKFKRASPDVTRQDLTCRSFKLQQVVSTGRKWNGWLATVLYWTKSNFKQSLDTMRPTEDTATIETWEKSSTVVTVLHNKLHSASRPVKYLNIWRSQRGHNMNLHLSKTAHLCDTQNNWCNSANHICHKSVYNQGTYICAIKASKYHKVTNNSKSSYIAWSVKTIQH